MCYVYYISPYRADCYQKRGFYMMSSETNDTGMNTCPAKKTRKRIYEIIEFSSGEDKLSTVYDLTMMAAILTSLVPLVFKQTNAMFIIIDKITVTVFILDYLLRLLTADFKLKRGCLSFFLYPFTFMALVDILSIFPSFDILLSGFKTLKILRLFRTFRAFRALKVFKAFKFFRYSRSIDIILDVIRSQKEPLIAVCTLSIGYILIAALVIFNVEPDTFENFFEAIYWACVSLTTMGYGDIYPVSAAGRIVTMVSSFVGIAIVALPAGIITAGYMDTINKEK